jgi:ribosomal protein S18 acetylase RimI-like enzyme
MNIVIRAAELRDRERLIDLYEALNRHEDRVTGDRRTDRAAAAENLDDSMARLIPGGGLFLVAEIAGEVAGLVTVDFKEGPVYVRPERRAHAHIVELVVDPARQRQGLGRALMSAAEEVAAARGYRRLTISVMAGNDAAEQAYARQGFRPLAHDLVKEIGSAEP